MIPVPLPVPPLVLTLAQVGSRLGFTGMPVAEPNVGVSGADQLFTLYFALPLIVQKLCATGTGYVAPPV